MQTTRGGIEPASIVNTSSNETVHCMFNPQDYTLTKRNSWEAKPVKGKNVPKVSFKSGGSQSLKLKLYFDTLADETDVRDLTDPLWKMMMVEESTRNQRSGKSQPPEVEFRWGKLRFKAVITNLSQKFLLFIGAGVPVRCEVDITLEQFVDVDDYGPQDSSVGDEAGSSANEQRTTPVQGDRLDNAIAAVQGDPSQLLRKVAEDNGLDNPLKLPRGVPIRVNPN